MCSVRPFETNEVDDKKNLNGLSFISIIVAAYLFSIIIIEQAPIGSYVMYVRVIGSIYDREAARGGTEYCTGTHCFRLSFLIVAFSTFVGFMIARGLFIRTRRLYEQIVSRRMEDVAELISVAMGWW
ncbi:hypothetical protein HanLR1_Chr07g0243081 [Helianthus annuus]|nr:hypothetical protein HanLR1_Chr07g0243081 [Helianthus annuus]